MDPAGPPPTTRTSVSECTGGPTFRYDEGLAERSPACDVRGRQSCLFHESLQLGRCVCPEHRKRSVVSRETIPRHGSGDEPGSGVCQISSYQIDHDYTHTGHAPHLLQHADRIARLEVMQSEAAHGDVEGFGRPGKISRVSTDESDARVSTCSLRLRKHLRAYIQGRDPKVESACAGRATERLGDVC